ncbi:MAG TPA: peroxiredoxin [Steroidobacteraceae bacterium]|nr:peroxiredoxin [Steroidobacteraceae bacterium]
MQDNHTDTACAASPQLGGPAPEFMGRSTHGVVRLADFRGRWLVFFAHPADFTPVCASELVAFAKRFGEFAALNCALLGLSVDSVYAHLAWHESIRQKFGVRIDFPVLEDVTMEIARRYGMVQAGNGHPATLRALFVIDDKGLLRAVQMYPETTGRSVGEVLRLLQALQTADRLHAMTPEGWTPGDNVIDPPPETVAAAVATRDPAYGCVDWYYWTRPAQTAAAGSTAPARLPPA